MGRSLGLSGFAQKRLSYSARWEQLGFLAKALRFFGKAFFRGLGLFEMATLLHDDSPVLAGPNPHCSALAILAFSAPAVCFLVNTTTVV
jgi:hypothetical protein